MLINKKFIISYVIALSDLAFETKKNNYFLKNCNIIIKLFKQEPDYIKLMMNSNYSKKERKNILFKTFKKTIDPLILNSFFLLIDLEYFYYILIIFKSLRNLININNNIQYGNIYSTIPLTKKQIIIIEIKLRKKFGYCIKLINKINYSLIGGILIKFKNKIIDGSILGQLKMIKQKVINNK